jgi:Fic family protein
VIELETVPVLKKAASAHRYLAELKGMSRSIPNQSILVNTLALQEAKDSSAIENIITTHDELFREESNYLKNINPRKHGLMQKMLSGEWRVRPEVVPRYA